MRINKFVINYLIGITYKEDLVADNFSDILSFDHPETIEDTTNRIKEYLDKFEYIRCDMVDYDLERTPFVTNDLIFKFEDTYYLCSYDDYWTYIETDGECHVVEPYQATVTKFKFAAK